MTQSLFRQLDDHCLFVPLFAIALAVIVWLIGFGCRYVSNARDAARFRHDTKRV